jgi:hypothetical protein
MSLLLRTLLIVSLPLVLFACDGKPSDGARGMPGAKGTITFKPDDRKPWTWRTSWWKDSEGIAPGIAGCHIGTDKNGVPNGRKFGEACLANGLLVESNPEQDKLHGHRWDIGHPDTFDCPAWCKGQGKETGVCEIASAPPCDSSAICACYGKPSDGAQGMPGAKGTIEFKPGDWTGQMSWWKDSDGVDPGVAGCHIGTDEQGAPNGRKFGEACLPNGLLVESNPGKDELHGHKDDTGHPDVFDCQAWCKGKEKETGVCAVAQALPCDSSAICVCE